MVILPMPQTKTPTDKILVFAWDFSCLKEVQRGCLSLGLKIGEI